MTVKDVIHTACNLSGISLSQAAENIGISRGSLWNRLDKNDGMNMRVETLIRYLSELGCEIYVNFVESDAELLLDGEDEEIALDRAHERREW